MQIKAGIVKELRMNATGMPAAWVECQPQSLPQPGQYLLGWAASDLEAALAIPLFPAELSESGFLASPIPVGWEPGTRLELHGPLGHGFRLPPAAQRLALGAVGGSLDRLLPLIRLGLERDMAITLYADYKPAHLPSAVEIFPLATLPEALAWADLLALDMERQDIPRLRPLLGGSWEGGLPCPVQALIRTPLPCGGVAECGVCAVAPGPVQPRGLGRRRHWKPACKDGPVFDLRELDW